MDFRITFMLGFCLMSYYVEALDFSQFYLPQCCYIPPTPAIAASSSNPAFRHDVKARKMESPQIIHLEGSSNKGNQSLDSVPETATVRKRKIAARLFRYIIPLDDENNSLESNEAAEESSKEESSIKFSRRSGKKMRKSLRTGGKRAELNARDDKLLSSAQIEPELQPMNITSNSSADTAISMNSSVEQNSTFSMNKTLESMLKFKRNINIGSNESQEHQRMHQKVPGDWMINLRRALYQSIDTMINKGANRKTDKTLKPEETLQAKSSNHNPQRSSQEETNRITELWHHLRQANLSLVEPLSRSASTLPENLYLPQGEGPIASGVVVNTLNGIQLRMASELYFPQDAPNAIGNNGCNCHLINNGDILMAYWSVSRIFNEDGNPALQYLIYPLPHNVPTPPRMIPFNQVNFGRPSPEDPRGNLVQEYSNQQQGQLGYTHVTQAVGDNFPTYEQLPPNLQEVHLETPLQQNIQQHPLPPQYEEAVKNLQYFQQIPQTGPVDDPTGYRGILIQNHQGYTPEFLEMYKQAVTSHLNHKDQRNQQLQQYQQQQGFPPTGAFPPQTGHITPGVVTHKKQVIPAHFQLFDGKSEFPKSIQDIITPGSPLQPGTVILQNQVPELGGPAGHGFQQGIHQPGLTQHGTPQHGIHQHQILQQGIPGTIQIPNLSTGTGGHIYHGVITNGNHQYEEVPYDQEPPPGHFYTLDPNKGPQQQPADYPVQQPGHFYTLDPNKGPQQQPADYPVQQPGHFYTLDPNKGPQQQQANYPVQPEYYERPGLQQVYNYPQHDQQLAQYPHHVQPPTHYQDRKRYHDHPRPPLSQSQHHNVGSSSEDDTTRYHRTHQSPSRHRSEKYSRRNEKAINPDGSYIINF